MLRIIKKIATKIKDTFKVGSSKCDVASDFLSLVREEMLVTMAYLLLGFYNKFWKTHFNIMEQCDPLMQKSRHISRHMAVQLYVMSKELDSLAVSHAHYE